MGIGDQFRGLDMKNLIGGPLMAAAESSVFLARSTADFINQVGFDADNKTRNVLFKYNRNEPDPDGNVSQQEMAVEVPLLAIVPIPNLQIDEVNIMFDMEVKQSEKSESSNSMNASLSASARIGPFSISIQGSVSAHSSNTRSSDNSAKYHVDVRATNHGIPEGLARVLDMMAATISPSMISSKPVDSSGAELTGQSKARNLELRRLREERLQLEAAENAARETYEIKLGELVRRGDAMRNDVRTKLLAEINNTQDSAVRDKLTAKTEAYNRYWDDFQSTIKANVSAVATSSDKKKLSALRQPPNDENGIPDITQLDATFDAAVEAYGKWDSGNKAVQENKVQYNNVMMGTAVAKPALA